MWYVVQVKTGSEESVRKQYMRLYEERRQDDMPQEPCFIPRYERMKRYQGTWHKERQILFPGYVFVISSDLEQMKGCLQRVIGLTKLLGMGGTVIPLTEEEVSFLVQFGGDDHVVTMSRGIVEGTQVIVTEGPLKGQEGLIRKIDRHKRKAWIEIKMFGRMQRVEVGMEVLEKRGREE